MANQYVNKVVLNGITRLDLSGDTVTADKLLKGYTAHDKTGAPITGTLESGGEAALTIGTVTLQDTNTLSGDVDFEALITANRDFYIFVEAMYFGEIQVNEIMFGSYHDGGMYLQYYESNNSFNIYQADIEEMAYSSSTLKVDISESVYFANVNYTVVYAEQTPMPSVITAGNTPVAVNTNTYTAASGASPTATGLTLTIAKAGTYRIKFVAVNAYTASAAFSNKAQARLYKNGTAVGTLSSLSKNATSVISTDVTCAAGDTLTVYASSAHSSYPVTVTCLMACIDWDNGISG